jgi:imidazole glycerol-phosphate synthase subunit HisH
VESPAVTVIDYGAGNIRSVLGAFNAIGVTCTVESDAERVRQSQAIVLPGVGSFKSAMLRLEESGMSDALTWAIGSGARVLGVCLGMQLLGEWSDEESGSPGLGVVPGRCRRFVSSDEPGLQIPHVGFNSVTAPRDTILFGGIPAEGDFYFAHSYRMDTLESCDGDNVATTYHGGAFVSAYEVQRSIFGVQFHPELSQGNGLQLLANFVRHASC